MLELLTCIFASLAVIWARKNDLQLQISDDISRRQLTKELLNPIDKLTKNLKTFHSLINKIIGDGPRIIGFCLLISLIFTSIAFLIAIAMSVGSAEDIYLIKKTFFPHYQRFLFALILVVAIGLYALAGLRSSAGAKYHKHTESVRRTSRTVGLHILGALFLCGVVHYTYRNWRLTFIVILTSISSAILAKTRISNENLRKTAPISVISGAALGVLGFVVATFSFTSETLPNNIWIAAAALAATSAVFALMAIKTSEIHSEIHVVEQPPGIRLFLSFVGRPCMFGGFYCARATGQFCAAVAILILVCDGLKFIVGTPVVVASAIIMELCIFAAGATNVSGAGGLAFGAMVCITFYIVFGVQDPVIIFHEWSYVLVFWIIVPFINMSFDSIRWFIVKKTLDSRIKLKYITSSSYLFLDILMLCLSLSALSILGPNAIRWYNDLAQSRGLPVPIPIDALLREANTDFLHNGVWFGIMLFSLLIPTIINIGIFISSGIMHLVPMPVRSRFAEECDRDDLTRVDTDRLAWKISAVDSLAGVIFFLAALIGLGYIVAWLTPAVGEVLYALSQVRLV